MLTAALSAERLWIASRPAPALTAEQAAKADPRDSRAWIDWGLELEWAGDVERAEQALLHAARFDRQYLPSWTLANFNFRRGDQEQFWMWAARAAPLIPDDARPLLTLAHQAGGDVLARLGGGRRLTRSYLDYLLGLRDYAAARPVALALAAFGDPGDDARIADTAGQLFAAGQQAAALALWNTRFETLDPGRGPWFANAGLQHKPTGVGFEAALPLCSGVTASWRPGRLRFDLDGTQPDGCVLYDQFLAGQNFGVSTTTDPPVHGLSWIIHDQPPRLKLVYRRPPGESRARGSFVLPALKVYPL